jgi:hypothetical protein
MKPFVRVVAVCSLSLTFALAGRAHAEDAAAPSAERIAAAKTLFDQAQAFMDQQNYREACAKFQASNQQVARVGTLLNLADCYAKNHQNASAWATYNDAISLGRRQGRPEYEEFARKKVNELEPSLVRLTVKVPKESIVDGLKVERDGVTIDVGAWETPIPIDPGPHEMKVSAPKKLPKTFPVTVDEKTPNTDFVVPPLDDAPVEKPKVETKIVTIEQAGFWTTGRTIGLAVGGVGVATLVGGIITGVGAIATWNSAQDRCGATQTSNGLCVPGSDAPTLSRTAGSLATASTALFVGGGVLTAAGVIVFLLSGPKPAESNPSPTVRLSPALAPGYAGLGLTGSW